VASCDIAPGSPRHIEIDVPLREKPLIQQLPGAKWHDATTRWRMPLSWASCKMLRGVFGDRLFVGAALAEWSVSEFEDRIRPALEARALALDPAADTYGDVRLYSYQRTGVAFLAAAGSGILGDDMGTGKTVQMARTLAKLDHDTYERTGDGLEPFLIVAPKSMQRTWAREMEKWADLDVMVLEGSVAQRRKQFEARLSHQSVVVSYDLLRAHSRLAPYGSIKLTDEQKQPRELNEIPFGVVVADEAHRAKDPKAQQTRALWAVGDKATHRFALTGTPIANRVDEFWSLLRFVSPDEWPSRTRFIDRYCLASQNFWGGLDVIGLNPLREAEFREIMEPRFLRRPKSLVLPHLPVKVYQRRDVEMSPKQARAYRELADGMVADLDSGTLVTFSPLVQGARLTQFASAMCDIDADGNVRMVEPSPKLDELEAILEELGDEPLAVFAASRQLIELAAARLTKREISHGLIVGGMHTLERDDVMRSYNDGKVRVILISLGAGAEGLSLTRGSTELFLDRSWSELQNKQGEDRLHGTGRGEAGSTKLTIIDLITRNTVEEHRVDVLKGKADNLEELVRDRDALRAALSHGRTNRKARKAA
jgi:SNF2 family DNA or RNA helicase